MGDTVKQKTGASLRRPGNAQPGVYRLTCTGPITVKLPGEAAEVSTDGGATWQPAETKTQGQWQVLSIHQAIPISHPRLIRIKE